MGWSLAVRLDRTIMLCCNAHEIYLLKAKELCFVFMYKLARTSHYTSSSLYIAANTLYVLLDNDCSIRVYQSFVAKCYLLCWLMLNTFSDLLIMLKIMLA